MWGARQARLLAPLALAAVVAACGGSGYTKSDFVARANAICASSLRHTRAIAPGSPLPTYLAALVPIVQSEANQLRALRRPPGNARDQASLSSYLASVGQVAQDYRQLQAAAQRGDTQAITNLEAGLRASPVAALAASYGLRSCGTPGSTAV
jgi:hypothetical protein